MNPRYILLPLAIILLALSCEDDEKATCVSGLIVGEKCGVVALQLDKNSYGAKTWGKKDNHGDVTEYENVIGLLNLNSDLNQIGNRIWVMLRKPTIQENEISCYLDLPGPPEPNYFILAASDSKCSEDHSK